MSEGERAFARTVVLDEQARQTLDYVCEHWKGGELAWLVIEWVLAHDPETGCLLTEQANLRGFEYFGARSINQPDLYVIYEALDHQIIVKVIGYDEAKAAYAGRA